MVEYSAVSPTVSLWRCAVSRGASVLSVVPALLLPVTLLGEHAHAALPPIQVGKGVKPKPSVFKAAARGKPLVIRSETDAAEHFADDAVAVLKKQVDFIQHTPHPRQLALSHAEGATHARTRGIILSYQ